MEEKINSEQGEYRWQLCPKCNGQGRVFYPPYLAEGLKEWPATQMDYECGVCHGAKVLAVSKSPVELPAAQECDATESESSTTDRPKKLVPVKAFLGKPMTLQTGNFYKENQVLEAVKKFEAQFTDRPIRNSSEAGDFKESPTDAFLKLATFSKDPLVQQYCQHMKGMYHDGNIMVALEKFSQWISEQRAGDKEWKDRVEEAAKAAYPIPTELTIHNWDDDVIASKQQEAFQRGAELGREEIVNLEKRNLALHLEIVKRTMALAPLQSKVEELEREKERLAALNTELIDKLQYYSSGKDLKAGS